MALRGPPCNPTPEQEPQAMLKILKEVSLKFTAPPKRPKRIKSTKVTKLLCVA